MFEELTEAIIVQAVEDYRNARSGKRIAEIEKFFLSDWFRELSELDGKKIVALLRAEREEKLKKGADREARRLERQRVRAMKIERSSGSGKKRESNWKHREKLLRMGET